MLFKVWVGDDDGRLFPDEDVDSLEGILEAVLAPSKDEAEWINGDLEGIRNTSPTKYF